jgi:hypothetical protein
MVPIIPLFEEWQKTRQENGSVISDPLFMADINQYDFLLINTILLQPNLDFEI